MSRHRFARGRIAAGRSAGGFHSFSPWSILGRRRGLYAGMAWLAWRNGLGLNGRDGTALLNETSNMSLGANGGGIEVPLKALLLRVGTRDRIALSEVLTINATQKAEAAREALAEFEADVVVADVGASDIEARALLEYLRDPVKTPRKGMPVIWLLAESSPEQVRALVKAGVDHVMIKPISATALRDLAHSLCQHPMPQVAVPRYVGPDRRRLPDASYTGPTRRRGE